ncbi:M23 family metallopeptidase [Mongoliitalea daihaiensis]|uniref:M23 family metallopeptidase n=1 Tax=Mongoliitalea daihaiensis TaxID=2782006 RepID=UPI001F39D1DA|nr:M23 family metallopeptidase [Mongoliitalea daihaiensis]UJP64219.1 M23 family metallopeptidase [Mongoliitalea daihaiensis]
MKLNNSFLWLCFWLGFSNNILAQDYLFPVKPGQRAALSGNFSEIRPSHFHSGIDVKIGGVDGEPILAIADGYIYRMKISTYGYGNVLYLRHNDGQSSVYAHLRNFSPKIMEFMRKELYFAKKNELEIFPDPDFLPIKRGEVIGNGGNTGSSGGPHLHFEIRDTLDRAIDPFIYRFREVVDNTPPIIYKMAIRPIGMDSRVNGLYQRIEVTPLLEGGVYVIKEPVKVSGQVGIEIHSIDRMDGSTNIFGNPMYELSEDGNLIFKANLQHIDFNKGRFFFSHMTGNKFKRLYKVPNNVLEIYEPDSTWSGAISVNPQQRKNISVKAQDFFGNARTVKMTLVGEEAPFFLGNRNISTTKGTSIKYDGSLMIIETGPSDIGTLAKVWVKSHEMEMAPIYVNNSHRIYTWDMRYGIPEQIDLCTETIFPSVIAHIPFGEERLVANQQLEIIVPEEATLDDLYLRVEHQNNRLKINDTDEYLRSPIEILWKETMGSADRERTHVYALNRNGSKSFVGGTWELGNIRFKTRNFGTFVLDTDVNPPSITPIRVTADELRFTIRDDKSGIKDFEALVNGEWVLMRYEHKQNVIWSEKLTKQAFKGELILKVRDMAGNETVYKTLVK